MKSIICKICNKEIDTPINLFFRNHLKTEHGISSKEYYDLFYRKKDEGYCKQCNKESRYIKFGKGYTIFCSDNCKKEFNRKRKEEKELEKRKDPDYHLSRKEKTRKTLLKRYGSETYNNIQKYKKTCLKKYGVDNYSKTNQFKKQASKRTSDVYKQKGSAYFSKNRDKNYLTHLKMKCKNNGLELVVLDKQQLILELKCLKCEKTFKMQRQLMHRRIQKDQIICTHCNPFNKNISISEKELFDFVQLNHIGEVLENDKKVLGGLELDIYIPQLKLAFEFNGLYWHSELHKPKDYHLNKTRKCNELGVQLIHIFEDDWSCKQDIVKSRILNLLGKNKERIYARKCQIEIVDNKESKQFLEDNHIQGSVQSKYRLGLYYEDELVSLMTLNGSRFEKNKIELLRFCNKLNTSVVGGASKLFKYFIRNYEYKEIISYADRSWSKGGLYEKLGFAFDKETSPNYHYNINHIRENRFRFRKSKLVEQGFDWNKTEKEIMFERGIYRVYDSGSLKYHYNV